MRTDIKMGIILGIVMAVAVAVYVMQLPTDDSEANKIPDDVMKTLKTDDPPNLPPNLHMIVSEQGDNDDIVTEPPVTTPEITPEPVDAHPTVVVQPAPIADPVIIPEPIPAIIDIPEAPNVRYHIVKDGESLYSISENYYGVGKYWQAIHETNSKLINNSNVLVVGWKLIIPDPKDITD